VGAEPLDIELDERALFVTGGLRGEITRFDRESGRRRTVAAGGQAGNMALAGGSLWVPSPPESIVTPIDAGLRRAHTGPRTAPCKARV
jgi:hypothetical protein